MQTNGANHTPSISQFQTASSSCEGMKSNQPKPRTVYTLYLANLSPKLGDGEERSNGRPRAKARVAASEKLSTEITEVMVAAKHRLRDFRSM